MSEARVFTIDGALCARDIKIIKPDPVNPTYQLPDMDHSYKWGMWLNNFLWCSKDAKNWGMAFGVEIDGEHYGIQEIEQMFK